MNRNFDDRTYTLKFAPNKSRKVFKGGPAKSVDFIKQLVIEHAADIVDFILQYTEIDHHPGLSVGRAAYDDFSAERMAVNVIAEARPGELVRCLEMK